jgi:hypothetical protein
MPSAMSSASRTLPIDSIALSMAAVTTGLVLWPWSSVATNPGSMTVTLMLECSASRRSASEKPATPNFVKL